MSHFLEAIHGEGVLLMDGAMGTELQRAGIAADDCYEACNLARPDQVRAIHEAYWQAGARYLLTNTFQSNPVALARHGLDHRLEDINQAAIRLCRPAGGKQALVIGSVGPLAPLSDAGRVFRSLRRADAMLLETWSDPRVFDLVPQIADQPVLVSISYLHTRAGLVSQSGHSPEAFAAMAEKAAITALGVNCGRDIGLDDVLAILRAYRSATSLPLFARPNAGTPRAEARAMDYPLTPEKLASRLPELVGVGIKMIGGCCGTTPAHIQALRSALTGRRCERQVHETTRTDP